MTTLRAKYPLRVPVKVESKTKGLSLDVTKFLVPKEFTMAQFMYVFRKHTKLDKSEAVFFLIDNKMVPSSKLIGSVDHEHQSKDGLLQIDVCKESTFGSLEKL